MANTREAAPQPRFRSWRRRRSRLTGYGYVLAAVTVGVGAAAINTGNNLLHLLLGLFMSLWLLNAVLSEESLRKLRIERRVPERAFAHTPCLVQIRVTNERGWTPSFALLVEDVGEDPSGAKQCFFLRVAPKDTQTGSYRRTFRARGLWQLNGYRIATRFPFGLIEKRRWVADLQQLVVYPSLRPAASRASVGATEHGGTATALGGAQPEIDGLRDYSPPQEARLIHWRRSASLGRLLARQRRWPSPRELRIVLDNCPPSDDDARWRQSFEAKVEEAAYLVAQAARRNTAITVATTAGHCAQAAPGEAPDGIWRFLALIRPREQQDSESAAHHQEVA